MSDLEVPVDCDSDENLPVDGSDADLPDDDDPPTVRSERAPLIEAVAQFVKEEVLDDVNGTERGESWLDILAHESLEGEGEIFTRQILMWCAEKLTQRSHMKETLAHSVKEACVSQVPQSWKRSRCVLSAGLREDIRDT